MYFIKNAAWNLWRNKGRNLLIGLVMLAIVASVTLALVIGNTSAGIINDYRERFGAAVYLIQDMEKVMAKAEEIGYVENPEISVEQYRAMAESPAISYCELTGYMGGISDGFHVVDEDARSFGGGPSGGTNSGAQVFFLPNLRVLGGKYGEFSKGQRKLVEGTMPSADGECIISQELAEKNGLKPGDTLTIRSMLFDEKNQGTDISFSLTLCGIYQDSTREYENAMMQNPMMNRRNEIITTFDTLAELQEPGKDNLTVDAQLYLKNPDMLEQFKQDAFAAGVEDLYAFFVDAGAYDKIVKPVIGLKNISRAFMVIVLVLGGIVLTLMTSIAIRERKYEIGVLRAMGMKKRKVAAGLWTELMLLAVAALTCGILVGSFAAQPVADSLLKEQVQIEEENSFPGGITVGPQWGNDVEPLAEIDTNLDGVTVLEIMAISLAAISLSGVIATSRITKYEPIKILMERN